MITHFNVILTCSEAGRNEKEMVNQPAHHYWHWPLVNFTVNQMCVGQTAHRPRCVFVGHTSLVQQ
jgi:hypothetical protein